jgi:hypothetical protein
MVRNMVASSFGSLCDAHLRLWYSDVMMQVAIVFSCCVHIATARRVDLPGTNWWLWLAFRFIG